MITIDVPVPRVREKRKPRRCIWSTNERIHWRVRSERTKALRTATALAAKAVGAGELPPSLVTIVIPFPAKASRRDPMNFVGTVVKAMVDGLVDAGLWPDDTPDYVTITQPRLVVDRDAPIRIEITPL